MTQYRTISLRDALGPVSFVGTGDIRATRFVSDSRRIGKGDVFVAMRGHAGDGHQFLHQAVEAGAAAVIVESPSAELSVPQCVVPNSRAAYSSLCMALHGRPHRDLSITGVTGTNGKTTTTWLLRSILQAAGHTTGLIGTIEYSDGIQRRAARLTTPDSMELAEQLRRMRQQQASHCIMELSSHALDQQRCAAVTLAAAAFTNLTQDHLDYHGTMESYLASKVRIAELLAAGRPLLCGLEPAQLSVLQGRLPNDRSVLTFGFDSQMDLHASVRRTTATEQVVDLRLQTGNLEIRTALTGRHNALNVLTAAGLAEQLGASTEAIVTGIDQLRSVPGRMERIDAGQPFTVLVDYAHTPDGLSHLVSTCRDVTASRVILVFGAGGDRDRLKRPLMAQAAQRADVVIVTSDNPRSESPDRIMADVCSGFDAGTSFTAVRDRQAAIAEAIRIAEPGDVLAIAGRGHETTQTIGDRCIGFDDRKVTRRLLLEQSCQFTATTVTRSA